MSLGWMAKLDHHLLGQRLCCSPLGELPPPPDCTEARWKSPAAEGMPISVVTLEPPPDWP